MLKSKIFSTLIKIVRPDNIRYLMEFTSCNDDNIIHQKVREYGLNVAGIGLYSVVVEHPDFPERVFKISTVPNDGFRAFAQYCKDNAGSKYLPVIHDFREHSKFAFYELDKLYPITLPTRGEDFINLRLESMYSYAHAGLYASDDSALKGTDEEKEIYKRTMHIRSTFPNYTPDLHTGNVMMNSKEEIFITDPLGGYFISPCWDEFDIKN